MKVIFWLTSISLMILKIGLNAGPAVELDRGLVFCYQAKFSIRAEAKPEQESSVDPGSWRARS